MNLFCRETRAHLRLHHPRLECAAGGSLITPDLWMKDCDPPSDENPSPIPSPVSPKEDEPPPVPNSSPPRKEKTSKKSPKRRLQSRSIDRRQGQTRPKKANGLSPTPESPSRSHSSPPVPRQTSNGPLLSPPPKLPPPRPCPPVPSPIGSASVDHGRPPFLPPSMVPPPFQFLAQQHMEAFFRSQHDVRMRMPPPFPLPPWVAPPYPQAPPPLPPMNLKSQSVTHQAPSSRNHHQSSNHKSGHHAKHKTHKHSSGAPPSHNKNSEVTLENPSPLRHTLPPVTVMVPFPLFIPVPLPIPVPIPIPPDIMEKVQQKSTSNEHEHFNNKDTVNEFSGHHKRKHSHESPQDKRKRKASSNGTLNVSTKLDMDLNSGHSPRFYNKIENLIPRPSDGPPSDFVRVSDDRRFSKANPDLESSSYSPVSEIISSNEEDNPKSLKNGDPDVLSTINFSGYNLSVMRSSPSYGTGQILLKDSLDDFCNSSPTNLSLKDKLEIESSTAVNFKKKHIRDQFSLTA